jgi:hypothetical protein
MKGDGRLVVHTDSPSEQLDSAQPRIFPRFCILLVLENVITSRDEVQLDTESPRTTKLYDGIGDEITLDEVEEDRDLTPWSKPLASLHFG